MPFLTKRCAHPGCHVPAGRVRCQDCGRAFCAAHVAATDVGHRAVGAPATAWTRFVCGPCAGRTDRALFVAAAVAAREQTADNAGGHWWDFPRDATGDRR